MTVRNISRYKPVGWRGESHRHYLASKGITTRRFFVRNEAKGNRGFPELKSKYAEGYSDEEIKVLFPRLAPLVELKQEIRKPARRFEEIPDRDALGLPPRRGVISEPLPPAIGGEGQFVAERVAAAQPLSMGEPTTQEVVERLEAPPVDLQPDSQSSDVDVPGRTVITPGIPPRPLGFTVGGDDYEPV